MGNAQKALVMAAGIFLAIALITIAVIMFVSAQEATKSAQDNFSTIQTELSSTVFASYDETVVSGSQVLNAIRKFNEPTQQFGIQVVTGRSPAAGIWYNRNVSADGDVTAISSGSEGVLDASNTTRSATNEQSPHYINPSGRFHSSLIYDDSNNVRAIVFRQR